MRIFRRGSLGVSRDLVKLVVFLSLSYGLWGLAYSSYSYLVRYYAKDLSIPYSSQALYEFVGNMLSIIIILAIGILADYIGRVRTAFATTLIPVSSPLILLVASSLESVMYALILLNISFTTGVVARNLMIIEIGGEILGRLIGVVMTFNSLAMIIGPLIGYYIKALFGYKAYFASVMLMFLISSLLILPIDKIYRRNNFTPQIAEETRVFSTRIIRDLAYMRGISGVLAVFLVFVVIDKFTYNMWAQLLFALVSYENIPSEISAYLLTTQNLSWFLSQYLFGHLSDKINPVYVISLSELLTGLSALTIALSLQTNYVIGVLISFILLGLSIASWIPSYNKFIQLNVSYRDRAIVLSLLNIYAILIGSPGPFVGSLIRDALIPKLTQLYLASILHIINAVAIITLIRRLDKK